MTRGTIINRNLMKNVNGYRPGIKTIETASCQRLLCERNGQNLPLRTQ